VLSVAWGIFLYSLVTGMGFDVSHSITNLGVTFLSKESCLSSAKALNELPVNEKQVGLDRGVRLRYICLALPQDGTSI